MKNKPEEGGITIDNEKDIICQTKEIVLVKEKEIQADFTTSEINELKQKLKKSEKLSQETQILLEKVLKDNDEKHIAIIFCEQQIKDLTQRIIELRRDLEQEILDKKREISKNQELERIIRKLREDEQVLIGLQNNFTELQTGLGNQITTLTIERNNIQQNLTNLENKLKRIQGKFLGSLFQSGKKKKKITNLNIKILKLGVQLTSKNQQINRLKNLRDRNQTITNLNRDVSTWKNSHDNSQRELTDNKRNYESTQNYLNKQVDSWRSSYYSKEREIVGLRGQISSLESEISNLKSDLKKEKEEGWVRTGLVSKVNIDTGYTCLGSWERGSSSNIGTYSVRHDRIVSFVNDDYSDKTVSWCKVEVDYLDVEVKKRHVYSSKKRVFCLTADKYHGWTTTTYIN